MELEIKRINHTGDGIGEYNGKVIFVPKTIIGDRVIVNDLVDKGSYMIGKVLKYIKRGDCFKKCNCPYYMECGGCQIMELSYDRQLDYKKNKVIDIMKKYALISINPKILGSDKVLGYRNKITLQVDKGVVGLYKDKTKVLVPINKCLLVSDKMNEVIFILSKNKNLLMNVKNIIIKEFLDKVMVIVKGYIKDKEFLSILKNKVNSIYINDKLIYGDEKLEENLDKYRYQISPESFFQINKEQTIKLYDKVKEYLGGSGDILDLYCGMASIGIYVSDISKSVLGIELNHSSVIDAYDNIRLNDINNVKVIEGDVGRLLVKKNTYDALIVDPPRSGLDKKTIDGVLGIGSKVVIYVSCNPITLARDIKRLSAMYQLEDITVLDLFPNTYHTECICLLHQKR